MKGTVRIGVEIEGDEAVVHTEGSAAPNAENLVIAVVSITPETIKKWIQVSDEVLDSTSEAFLRYIYDELTYRVAKKAAARLLAKIQAAGTVSTNTATTNIAVAAISTNAIDVGLVAEAMGELTDEAADPVIIMNKKTWSAFKRVQYANGYNVDPFEGLPVLFNNSIKSFAAATTGEAFLIVGDLGAGAQMNFPVGDEVKIKYDDMDDAEADLVKIVSRLPVGSAVIKEFAFCQVKKA
jgi:HK97 family phage major capsid protein